MRDVCGSIDYGRFGYLYIHLQSCNGLFKFIVYNLSISVKIHLQVRGDNFFQFFVFLVSMLYCSFDIFMILYFGNEIKLGSDRLSYHLFESDWMDRPQSIKRNVIIFGEFLMQPTQLIVLKLYPLTLETFTRVCLMAGYFE